MFDAYFCVKCAFSYRLVTQHYSEDLSPSLCDKKRVGSVCGLLLRIRYSRGGSAAAAWSLSDFNVNDNHLYLYIPHDSLW